MPTPDITLPEVQVFRQIAEFYREGDRDFVKISYAGQKDNVISKVKPEHMAQFRDQWNAYCDGVPMQTREGTKLSDIEGVSDELAKSYVARNVHNAEELAALSDIQCQGLGHGTLTLREKARKLLMLRRSEQMEFARKTVGDAVSKISTAPAEPSADLTEIKQQLSDLTSSMSQLVGLLTADAQRKKGGRPKKEGADEG